MGRKTSIRQRPPRAHSAWPYAVVLCAAVLFAYQPAWHGGMLWDDDAHLTREGLQSLAGLRAIWFDVGATQQYYPVVHSAFWTFFHFWGFDPLGYHLVNIALHAVSAVLLIAILRRLSVPGARLAGFVFALHPVHVESVAWMTELKNTLSTSLVLGAALMYLRFDERRDRRAYALSLALFVVALLSKTVTAALPAALLVVFWWQRGRIEGRRDVRPLLPFFVAGAGCGLLTAWFERSVLHAQGAEFDLSLVQRVLLAGRAIWFYLWSLVWPVNLAFIYPRWRVDPAVATQYVFPVLVIAALGALWWFRSRTRAPLAVALPLGLLTWNQAHDYRDAPALYRATLARNAECWLCYNNLARGSSKRRSDSCARRCG